MGSASRVTACVDCGDPAAELLDIRRRQLCHECFVKYVSTKVRKRLDMYRFKPEVGAQQRKLLLPLSGGPSSLALLCALDIHLKKQFDKRGQTAYDLILVHIKTDAEEGKTERWRNAVQRQFPGHQFLPLLELQDLMRLDDGIEQDLQTIGLTRQDDESDTTLIARLFTSTKTASAKSDLHELLLKRLIVASAKGNECAGILWGHSDTRLAAKALADVAKGRGGSIPCETGDNASIWGINLNYPVRDLYKAELKLFTNTRPDDLAECILEDDIVTTAPVSIKSTSIDNLLTSYITSQGEKYPNIMANVVRTAGKLQAPATSEDRNCGLCFTPMTTIPVPNKLCYGCTRMKLEMKI